MSPDKEYGVMIASAGIYVTDQSNNMRYFITGSNGVYWINSPFDEDVKISGDQAEYIIGIAESTRLE